MCKNMARSETVKVFNNFDGQIENIRWMKIAMENVLHLVTTRCEKTPGVSKYQRVFKCETAINKHSYLLLAPVRRHLVYRWLLRVTTNSRNKTALFQYISYKIW